MTIKVLVAGSGAIGLRTALELTKRSPNVQVALSAAAASVADLCSVGAGGLWMPYHCDDARVDSWARQTLQELLLARQKSDEALVEIVPAIQLFQSNQGPQVDDFLDSKYQMGQGGKSPIPSWAASNPQLQFQHLTVEMLHWQNQVFQWRIPSEETLLAAGYKHAWVFETPIVDCPNMLRAMEDELKLSSQVVHLDQDQSPYSSLDDLVEHARSMDCHAIVNCTGLGAASLVPDPTVIPGRGILHMYDRQDCPRAVDGSRDACILVQEGPWGSEEYPAYLIPRGDSLVVGGSYLEGDTTSSISKQEAERLVQNAQVLGIDTSQASPFDSWVGFRPVRTPVRLEVEARSPHSIPIIHSYGYGGSGWTVFVGATKEAAGLVLESVQQ